MKSSRARTRGAHRMDKAENRGQREEERLRVLAFGSPGNSFDTHRMNREKRSDPEGMNNAKLHKHAPKQQHRCGVQQNVVEVIERRLESYERVFDPKSTEDQRVVLRRRPRHPNT